MPRLTKFETRTKLRNAVIAEVVEKGFRAVSVGGVAARAKVSAGTIYVHFEDKEDMLQQVFLEVKREFHDIMVAARQERSSAKMIKRMWFDMFAFVAARPSDFLFLELGGSAKFLTARQAETVRQHYEEIGDMLILGVDDGTLADLGAPTLSLLLVAPAMQLARSAVLSGVSVSEETVKIIFNRVWRSIAAEGVPVP